MIFDAPLSAYLSLLQNY